MRLFFYIYTMSKGLGDIVEDVIKKVTLGKVKACTKCNKRKAYLNNLNLPFSNYREKK